MILGGLGLLSEAADLFAASGPGGPGAPGRPLFLRFLAYCDGAESMTRPGPFFRVSR